MSQLSHKKARALLQKEADLLITSDEKAALDEHLFGCESCHSYAKNLFELEEKLRKATHTRWNGYTLNLEFQSLTNPTRFQESSKLKYPLYKSTFVKIIFVATLALASLLVTKMLGKQSISSLEILSVTPTRTPLAEHIETTKEKISKESCDPVQYIVKESDTLENIAFQFEVSKERIIEQNHLVIEKIRPGTNLLIPLCAGTPTRTAMIPNYTHTTTPTDFTK